MHAAVVETDPETAEIRILRYCVVHDCGTLINPMIVEGQVHGGVAQGVGGALYERMVYDEHGQLLNASFMDFLMPYATEVPTIEIDHLETPSPLNPLGIKGAGEAGVIPGAAVIAAAIEDAEGFRDHRDADLADRAVSRLRAARSMKISGERDAARRRGSGCRTRSTTRRCSPARIPGCQRAGAGGADAYRLRVAGAVASVAGEYAGVVRVVERPGPRRWRSAVRARGPGTVSADAGWRWRRRRRLDAAAVRRRGGGRRGAGRGGAAAACGVGRRMAERFFAGVDDAIAGASPEAEVQQGGTADGRCSRVTPSSPVAAGWHR